MLKNVQHFKEVQYERTQTMKCRQDKLIIQIEQSSIQFGQTSLWAEQRANCWPSVDIGL